MDKILELSEAFRKTLADDLAQRDYIGCELREFPGGACEVTSIMLALYLTQMGYSNITLHTGKRAHPTSQHHVWLKVEDLFVDITPSQFSDFNQDIIVNKESAFLDSFKPKGTRSFCIDDINRDNYIEIYSDVFSKLTKIT